MLIKSAEFLLNNVDLDIEESAQVQIFDGVNVKVLTGDGSLSYVR